MHRSRLPRCVSFFNLNYPHGAGGPIQESSPPSDVEITSSVLNSSSSAFGFSYFSFITALLYGIGIYGVLFGLVVGSPDDPPSVSPDVVKTSTKQKSSIVISGFMYFSISVPLMQSNN